MRQLAGIFDGKGGKGVAPLCDIPQGRSQHMPLRRRSDSHPRRDPITEAIAWRAFELFLARGGQDGHDLDDWLQAEREFKNAAQSRATASEKSTSS
jgi:hypothetical protein